jgi:hypothetical protein
MVTGPNIKLGSNSALKNIYFECTEDTIYDSIGTPITCTGSNALIENVCLGVGA